MESLADPNSLRNVIANPDLVEDWHVPVPLVNLNKMRDKNWDLMAATVSLSELGGDKPRACSPVTDRYGAITAFRRSRRL